jgi:pimeloyl-ACP methyl ester carboxylesterase
MFRLINFFMGSSPRLHRRMMRQTAAQVQQTPDKFFAQWGRMSTADGRLFESRPAVKALIAAEMQEAVVQNIDAILQEHPLYKRPWGFDLHAITLPVDIWHGLADPQAAPAWSAYLAAHIPHAIPHFVPDEGHFSILANHQAGILARLIKQGHGA